MPAVPPLPAQELVVTGAQAGAPVSGLAIVGLAGAVAVIAARGWLRTVVGVLLLAAGVGVVSSGVLFDPGAALSSASSAPLGRGASDPSQVRATGWPLVAAGCGLVLALAGAVVAVRGGGWSTLSQRYESPAARAPAAVGGPEAGERALWEALDRGEDPTSEGPGASPAPRAGEAHPDSGPDRPGG